MDAHDGRSIAIFHRDAYVGDMTARRLIFLLVGLGIVASGCASSFEASTVVGATKASNAFGFDLYRETRAGRDNFVCSPVGASIALTMTAAGAREETQAEMLHVLHINPANLDETYTSFAALMAALKEYDGKSDLSLTLADRVWAQKGYIFKDDYLSLLGARFRAPLSELDFAGDPVSATAVINRWASDETHGRIPKILGEVDETDRLVLANAVYLKAKWLAPFEAGATRDDWFTTPAAKLQTKMMWQEGQFKYAKVRGAKLLELPYQSAPLAMVIILPDSDDGLAGIEERLSSSYDDWIRSLDAQFLDVKVPRFASDTSLPLVKLLKRLGIVRAFNGCKSNFSGMNGFTLPKVSPEELQCPRDAAGNLYIGNAIQKAWIETNEAGSEAAAVTVVEIREEVDSAEVEEPRPKPIPFHADHPFVYVIRDTKTGVILFAGRVLNPAESKPTASSAPDVPEQPDSDE
jgi:serpin B